MFSVALPILLSSIVTVFASILISPFLIFLIFNEILSYLSTVICDYIVIPVFKYCETFSHWIHNKF